MARKSETVSYTHLDVYKRQVLTMKSLEAFEKASNGRATKIIIPSEIQGIAGLVKSVTAVSYTHLLARWYCLF